MESDPRVFFASERTLLAWLRTGLAVVGLGFLIARFGLFLAMARNPESATAHLSGSSVIGTVLVGFGGAMIALAAWQHRRFCQSLSESQRPTRYWLGMSFWVSSFMSLLAWALAVYLILSVLHGPTALNGNPG